MKGLLKSFAFLGFVVAVASVLFYLYKTKCPHACRADLDCEFEDEEEDEKDDFVPNKKKTASHARGYFNLNRIREAEGIIRE